MEFRSILESDAPLLLDWLQRPHVKEWWNDGDDTLEKVRDHYLSDLEKVSRFILFCRKDDDVEKVPTGYFQYYYLEDNVIGIDQYLAASENLNRGLGTKAILLFISHILEKHKPSMIIVDPDPENKRAIRCYEKIGFKYIETQIDSDKQASYIMQLK